MPTKQIRPTSANDDDEGGPADAGSEKRSVRSAGVKDTGKTETSQAQSAQSAMTVSSGTHLSELANLDLKYTSKFVQYWLHSKVSVRLCLILTVPFISLIILLVSVITAEISNGKVANDVVVLAKLVDHLVLVLKQLSTEHTDSLWWSLDKTLNSGINANSGGITGKGLKGEYQLTDAEIQPMLDYIENNNLRGVSKRVADMMALISSQATSLYDLRYNVEKWRVTNVEVDDYFHTLMNYFLETIDLCATLADSRTIQSAQALATWVRAKTGVERERHICGELILRKSFPLRAYTNWLEQIDTQNNWNTRFLAIAPDKWRNRLRDFQASKELRLFQELRIAGTKAFIPGDPTSLPPVEFQHWMNNATVIANFYRDVRIGITDDILSIANDSYNTFVRSLSLYIVLAILAAFFSISIALLVGWSIDMPWRAMLRMKDKMFSTLKEQEARDVIVSQFLPSAFLEFMGLKTIFDLQLGNCILKRATIVCSEIRNFSKLSERMAPQQNFQFLSMWLQDSGPIIRRHQGFIEKFRGSGLVAIFPDPNDALDAALEVLEATQTRNQEANNASTQLESGISVHTGDLMLGTVGDQMRVETAVISEALAIALQMTQFAALYGANLILSRETYALLNVEGLSVRFLGEGGLHGVHHRPHMYEVLQPSDEAKMDTLNEYSQAIKFQQDGDYEKAATLFATVLEVNPADVVSRRRLQLCEKHEWADLL